jgi:hypothetical protein
MAGQRNAAGPGQAGADLIVARQFVFAAPAVEQEAGGLLAPAGGADDGRGIAQPDVAERHRQHGDVRAGDHGAGGIGRLDIGGDQHDLLAPAVGGDGAGEGDHLGARRLQILEPQLGMAGEADPHRLVRRPFGRLAHDRTAFSVNRGNRMTALPKKGGPCGPPLCLSPLALAQRE